MTVESHRKVFFGLRTESIDVLPQGLAGRQITEEHFATDFKDYHAKGFDVTDQDRVLPFEEGEDAFGVSWRRDGNILEKEQINEAKLQKKPRAFTKDWFLGRSIEYRWRGTNVAEGNRSVSWMGPRRVAPKTPIE